MLFSRIILYFCQKITLFLPFKCPFDDLIFLNYRKHNIVQNCTQPCAKIQWAALSYYTGNMVKVDRLIGLNVFFIQDSQQAYSLRGGSP